MCSRTRAGAAGLETTAPLTRRGFTLVEVLLAVVLINVGLLALVAGSATLLRQTNELRIRRAALQAATNRLQLLGAVPCVAGAGVESGLHGMREQWSIDVLRNGVRELRDSVSFPAGREQRAFVLTTRLPC